MHSCLSTPMPPASVSRRCGSWWLRAGGRGWTWLLPPSHADIRDQAHGDRRRHDHERTLTAGGWRGSWCNARQYWYGGSKVQLVNGMPDLTRSRASFSTELRWIGCKVLAAAGDWTGLNRSVSTFFSCSVSALGMSWFHALNYPSLCYRVAEPDTNRSENGCHQGNLLTFKTARAVKQVTSDS